MPGAPCTYQAHCTTREVVNTAQGTTCTPGTPRTSGTPSGAQSLFIVHWPSPPLTETVATSWLLRRQLCRNYRYSTVPVPVRLPAENMSRWSVEAARPFSDGIVSRTSASPVSVKVMGLLQQRSASPHCYCTSMRPACCFDTHHLPPVADTAQT